MNFKSKTDVALYRYLISASSNTRKTYIKYQIET